MENFEQMLVEILTELRELRRDVAKLQRDLSDMYKKLAEVKISDTDVAAAALREGVDKLNAAVDAVVENISLVKSLYAEEKIKQDEVCLAVLEKLMAGRNV